MLQNLGFPLLQNLGFPRKDQPGEGAGGFAWTGARAALSGWRSWSGHLANFIGPAWDPEVEYPYRKTLPNRKGFRARFFLAFRPRLWFKALPILGLYPSWNSGSSVQYNGLLERPLSIVPLREDSVMCQFSTCPNPAAFMVCNTTGSMKALCREHLISLGVAESELPKPDRQ